VDEDDVPEAMIATGDEPLQNDDSEF
jgi:ribosomal protein L19